MHAINIISGISMMGVLFGTAALVILLSVFNGFEKVILSLYSNFTPEIKIEAQIGKTFDPNTPYFSNLHKDARLFSFTEVLQERALIKYGRRTYIATVKGVSDEFLRNTKLDSIIQNGSFTLKSNGRGYAVIGTSVQSSLGMDINNEFLPLNILSPKHVVVNSPDPLAQFNSDNIYASGVFSIQQDFDDIVVVPISFLRQLLDKPEDVSSIELNYKPGTNLDVVQEEIEDKIGDRFTVKNRAQQDIELYKTLNFERWSIFMILTFVLIIAIFNIIGTLTMLVIDKKKDIAVLTSLGANKQIIKGIFFCEGMLISLVGCIAGMILGVTFCILQQRFSLIKMGGKMSVIDAYPIDMKLSDFGLVFLTVGIISVVASAISAQLSIKGLDDIKQDL
ncbi:FtsX-like permease family protein [Mucilaginibacter puniceus]